MRLRWPCKLSQHPALWLIGLSTCCCLALIVPLLCYSTKSQLYGDNTFGCDPNGQVFIHTDTRSMGLPLVPSRWNAEYTLGVTIGFGQLTYTAAKSIDEIWNFVVGRGGLVLGGLVVYRSFRHPVSIVLLQHHRPYRTALALEYAPVSIYSFWQYAREALRWGRHRHLARFTAAMLLLSTAFVLASPTWLSAMTGYRAKMLPMFPWPGGTYLSSDKLVECATVIKDGARVGLENNTCVPTSGDLTDAVVTYMTAIRSRPHVQYEGHPSIYWDDSIGCDNFIRGEKNQWNCGGWKSFNVSSVFTYNGKSHDLGSPSLTILSEYPKSYNPIFGYDGHIVIASSLKGRGFCQAQEEYQWGFSFLLTFAFLVTISIWLIALGILGICMAGIKEDKDVSRIWGPYRTAISVTRLLEEDLQRDVNEMSEKEIQNELVVRRRKKGTPLLPDKNPPRTIQSAQIVVQSK